MISSRFARISILVCISIITFVIFFADGYLQWVNSDTAGEAYALSSDISFPQALISEKGYRSRIVGHTLSFIPFNIAGRIYSEIFNDPVNALYFSQGIMTGTIYTLLILISAAYVSFSSSILSWRYIFSAFFLMLFTMALTPIIRLNLSFGLSIRFSHQAVMTNYVGTMVIALIAIFPYWRYCCNGKWDDIYRNIYFRTIFYLLIISATFSSTTTSIWLIIFSISTIIFYYYFTAKKNTFQSHITFINDSIRNDNKYYPLLLMTFLGIMAIGADSFTNRGSEATAAFVFTEYINVLFLFFSESKSTIILASLVLLFVITIKILNKKYFSKEWKLLLNIIPYILFFNLVFIFVIGTPKVFYRFGGYNLGRDTILIATWIIVMWIIAASISFFRERRFTWIAPFVLFALFTNALNFFSFPYYGYRADQKNILQKIYNLDRNQPLNNRLVLHWNGLAFSYEECVVYTIPMLKRVGIISPQREVVVAQ